MSEPVDDDDPVWSAFVVDSPVFYSDDGEERIPLADAVRIAKQLIVAELNTAADEYAEWSKAEWDRNMLPQARAIARVSNALRARANTLYTVDAGLELSDD